MKNASVLSEKNYLYFSNMNETTHNYRIREKLHISTNNLSSNYQLSNYNEVRTSF